MYFSDRDNRPPEHFVEWNEDPLVLRIHGLTRDLHEQMAISCLLGLRKVSCQQRRDIMMVNVDHLRDKYFGETEKNLTRLFDEIQAYLGQGQGGGVGAGAGSGRR